MEDNKYSRGKIYKLVPKVYEGEYIAYYGSTVETYLSKRLQKHKASYKMFLEGKTNNNLTSFKLFEDQGLDNIDIILVEDYPCNNKYELEARERFYIFYIEGNICLNKVIPTRTLKEYYIDNKLNILKVKKNYEINNKDKIKEQRKKYRNEHKVNIKEKYDQYYQRRP